MPYVLRGPGVFGSYDDLPLALAALDLARCRRAAAGAEPASPGMQPLSIVGPDGTLLVTSDYQPAGETSTLPAVDAP